MTTKEFLELAEKYEKGTCSQQEKMLFEDFCNQFKEDELKWDLKDDGYKSAIKHNIYKRVEGQMEQNKSYRIAYWMRPVFRVAAVLFLVVCVTFLFYDYGGNTNYRR